MQDALSPYEQMYRYCPSCKAELVRKWLDERYRFACPNCSFIFWNNPKPVVSAVIDNDLGQILMIQRAQEPLKGFWVLPGGFIDYEETPEASVVREVKEETGLVFKSEQLVGVYRIENDPRGVTIDVIYSGRASGKMELSVEHSVATWFGLDDLPAQIAYKHRQAIEDWYKI